MPFPFVGQPRLRLRPALVLASPETPDEITLTWTAIITGKLAPIWPGDVLIGERFAECGLLIPSVVRTAKTAAIDHVRGDVVGRLPDDLWTSVQQNIRTILRWR